MKCWASSRKLVGECIVEWAIDSMHKVKCFRECSSAEGSVTPQFSQFLIALRSLLRTQAAAKRLRTLSVQVKCFGRNTWSSRDLPLKRLWLIDDVANDTPRVRYGPQLAFYLLGPENVSAVNEISSATHDKQHFRRFFLAPRLTLRALRSQLTGLMISKTRRVSALVDRAYEHQTPTRR